MNKRDTIKKISELSQIAVSDCEKVLVSLEEVLSEELSKKKRIQQIFNMFYKIMSILKNKMPTLLLSLLFPISAYSQQTVSQQIRGVIKDQLSGEAIPMVSVKLLELPGISTQTTADGHFSLQNVPIGRYSIQASCVGYTPTVINEIILSSGKEVLLEITMLTSEVALKDVVINYVSNKEQVSNKMALTGGRLLRMEEAGRYAGGMDDPARLVSSFAGVSPNVGNNGISVHGNAPSLLQWRMEGVEIPNPNHFADIATLGGGVLSSLSTNVLANSDFYIGAFPAEYNNAVSGVFDMKLRKGNNRKYEHTFQAGLLGLDFASEGPFSKNSDASYLFNYRYSTTGLMSKISSGDHKNQLLDYQDLNFKLNFPTKRAGIFSIWGTGLVDKFRNKKEQEANWKYTDDGKYSEMKQTTATAGISHQYYPANGGTFRSTLASSYSSNEAIEDYYDDTENTSPYLNVDSRYTNLIFTSSFDKQYSSRHTNKTGFTLTRMQYNMNFELAPYIGNSLESIAEGTGHTNLISAYSSSRFELSDKLSATIGINAQMLNLNKSRAIEPRASIRWQTSPKNVVSLAYGLHSRMEKMDVYYVKDKITGHQVNQNLDFIKTHHILLSYQYKISENMSLKAEPYFQYLFNLPVIADSSYSVLNRSLFYVEDALVNQGKGRNFGVDVTLEKYLNKGFYYIMTASIFDSKYTGGDGIWHNTKFNRRFIVNGLAGKEWRLGVQKRDVLSVNLKLTLQGGDRYTPVDETASFNPLDHKIGYEETKAYTKQFAPLFLANYSISYRINRSKRAQEFAVKWLNATGTKEYYGHAYNLKSGNIEPKKQATSLFNILYRIDF